MSNVIFLFPHPDDEAVFMGGTIARHIDAGDKVFLICASNGERSGNSEKRSRALFYFMFRLMGKLPVLFFVQKLTIKLLSILRRPDPKLSEMRKGEAEEAMRILGACEIIFWEIEDMKISKNAQKIAGLAERALNSIMPDKMYILHPNGITDHPDHTALTKLFLRYIKTLPRERRPHVFGATITKSIIEKYSLPLIGVSEADISVETRLNEIELAKKKLAVQAYKSQQYLWSVFLEKYPELLEKEYFVKLY
ncbi:MAG: PIG-L family deacetylase [Parcubacteria group bacterium]|jgi:LmbE family N-acetylglucosaminyl deacetylase